MVNWIVGLLAGAAVAGLLAFSGIGGAPAALGQAMFAPLLLLLMALILLAAVWNR